MLHIPDCAAVVDFTTLLGSATWIVCNCLWLNYPTLCEGLGLDMQGLGLETKVLALVL